MTINGIKNFRRSKSSNAYENCCIFNSNSSHWNLGFLFFSRKIKSTRNYVTNYGKDLIENTEFRIKWPRGLLGSLPADSEQFMLIEELYKQMDKIQIRVDGMLHNEVNITALNKAVEKLQSDVEKLKDKQRSFANGNNH